MLLAELREQVCAANKELVTHGLVTFTWGNVSGFDEASGLIAIKPSGVEYDQLTPEKMVIVDLEGNVVEGDLRPSSDTPTHAVLYKRYPQIKGIVHTHSSFATAWAQAGRGIPALGTTHADYFYGEIPCARALTDEEINGAYELETGHVIIETIADGDPMEVPGILVREHAPFAWGKDPHNAVHNAVVVEEVAKMALHTMMLNPQVSSVNQTLLDKHYLRKHGKNAYYGQK
ncbi:L-ribulose-5-phosphate 4-epimerase [Gynuella sunshinyii]|uniref:L-ribulose-5-phosphate 4-epimerase n=1 Tax=Gynuella sunshinyii YC6258 TaxID=1445510 RepID=A0A0C5VDX4_9GAMM|nr:L-ribulose-5-phosphate 4-epimerase [Gynuella sunshinyii]AJQ92411.1 ribulose-5-phosphate 4-epimerase and related epimerase and aldolase [Gynuella sunshinyii YC6258]